MEEALVILDTLQASAELLQPLSALALLALAGLGPEDAWSDAGCPMLGVTEIMNFVKRRYDINPGAEGRESLQRQTLPFFKLRRLILLNADNPHRQANSRYCVYQLDPAFVAVLKTFGSELYMPALACFRDRHVGLGDAVGSNPNPTDLPAVLPSGEQLWLPRTLEGEMTRSLLEVFCPKFAPGGDVLHVAGAPGNHALGNRAALKACRLFADPTLDLPDLVIHGPTENRFVLVDVAHRRGPIDDLRRQVLEKNFAEPGRRLVLVTAFRTRLDLVRTIDQIASDTSVWIAESPFRLIHVQSGNEEANAENIGRLDARQKDAWVKTKPKGSS